MDIFKEAILDWIYKHWYSLKAPIVIIFVVSFSLISLIAVYDTAKYTNELKIVVCIIIIIIVTIVVFSCWLHATKYPKPKKGNIGYVIALRTENEKQNTELASDFIERFRFHLDNNDTSSKFDLIIPCPYRINKIISEDNAKQFLLNSRSHFIIYGRARERLIKGAPVHKLDINAIVRRGLVKEIIAKKFANEFADVMPTNIAISKENSMIEFEFTADEIHNVSQYIMGIAAFVSYDYQCAQSLFESLQRKLGHSEQLKGSERKIQTRINAVLADTYRAQADTCHRRWEINRNITNIDEMKIFLDKWNTVDPTSYHGRLLRSLWHFVKNRDVDSAISEMKNCSDAQKRDATWIFNYGFLLAYRGELPQARHQYENASTKKFHHVLVMQLETFLLWLLEEEPEHIELHYCLGVLIYLVRNDEVRASQELEAFLTKTEAYKARYRAAREHTMSILSRIRQAARNNKELD